MKFLPTQYVKDIYHISYEKLKQNGITHLIFDLDNTVRLLEEVVPSKETEAFFRNLQKDFTVILLSNNLKREVMAFANQLRVPFFSLALKPSRRGLRKIQRKFGCQKGEMAVIGDQLVTDILAGNRFSIMTILVDPLSDHDLKVTGLNRKIESYILKRYQRLHMFERGNYYE